MGSKEITQDGETYILKSSVEGIISSRLKTYAAQIAERDGQIQEMQAKLDASTAQLGNAEKLQARVTTLEQELSQANTRYDRHSTLSTLGITDDSVRGTFEYLYSQAKDDKGNQPSFSDWVDGMSKDPSKAPVVLQSFLQKQEATPAPPQTPEQPQTPQAPQQPRVTAPNSNGGVVPDLSKMSNDDILSKASDPSFYRQNRELIQSIYRTGQRPTQPRT